MFITNSAKPQLHIHEVLILPTTQSYLSLPHGFFPNRFSQTHPQPNQHQTASFRMSPDGKEVPPGGAYDSG